MAEFAFALHRWFLVPHLNDVYRAGCDASAAERAEVTIQHFRYERPKEFRSGRDLHARHFSQNDRASLIGVSHIAYGQLAEE